MCKKVIFFWGTTCFLMCAVFFKALYDLWFIIYIMWYKHLQHLKKVLLKDLLLIFQQSFIISVGIWRTLFIAVIALTYIYHCFCSKKLCGDLMCSSWICLLALNLKTFPGKLYLILADTEGSTAHPITLIWLETVYCFNCKYFIWITFCMPLPCISIRNPELHLEKNTFIQYFLRDFICLI